MLKGLDPLLSPDLLHVLAQMGHGDQIALVDRNFPAASTARRLVQLVALADPSALIEIEAVAARSVTAGVAEIARQRAAPRAQKREAPFP